MNNPRISADWSTIKQIAPFSCTPGVQVHTIAEFVQLTPGLLGLGVILSFTHRKCIEKHMINPRISAEWSTTNRAFSCTPGVEEVHTKAEVVQLNPGLLSLGVILSCHA